MTIRETDTVQSAFLKQQPVKMLIAGYKQSGYGREMGHAVLDAYTQVKTVWVNLR